jgi:putative endonuclease
MSEWFVYILECHDGSFYTGMTSNVENRMLAHQKGLGSKYVKKKGFNQLLFYAKCLDRSDAYKKEYLIKQLPKYEKLAWFRRQLNKETLPLA